MPNSWGNTTSIDMAWTSAVLDFRESYPAILPEEGPQVGKYLKYRQEQQLAQQKSHKKMTDPAEH
jgi:hypothetical protein